MIEDKNWKEGDTSEISSNVGDSTDSSFFCPQGVEKSGKAPSYMPIQIRMETLINQKCDRPFDWYHELDLDKSYASKIRRGLLIPPKWLRIKIAQYFGTDSATIWTAGNLEYINSQLKKQEQLE